MMTVGDIDTYLILLFKHSRFLCYSGKGMVIPLLSDPRLFLKTTTLGLPGIPLIVWQGDIRSDPIRTILYVF